MRRIGEVYSATLEWLYSLEATRGMDFKLARVRDVLTALDTPQTQYPTLHVAGTNGKGSVAAMLHAMLRQQGYTVGLYTSPHLVDFRERVRVGETRIPEADVVTLIDTIRTMAHAHHINLTFFEYTTVMAFLYFAQQDVDVAVIEVGLGGRLDATNVLQPAVTVITSIGLDHTQFLGDTVAQVAAEKAGIISADCPVVIGDLPTEAVDVVREIAATQHAPLSQYGQDFQVTTHPDGQLDLQDGAHTLTGCTVGLRGHHQRINAAVAVAALHRVQSQLPVTAQAMREGLRTIRWPGRIDVVSSNPLMILDGAHNLEALQCLLTELPALLQDRRCHLLFGTMQDKPWPTMIEQLLHLLTPQLKHVTLTRPLPPRGALPDVIAQALPSTVSVECVPDPVTAYHAARAQVADDEALIVTGSLFLLAAVYPEIAPEQGRTYREVAASA